MDSQLASQRVLGSMAKAFAVEEAELIRGRRASGKNGRAMNCVRQMPNIGRRGDR
jgi:hypothetical protein